MTAEFGRGGKVERAIGGILIRDGNAADLRHPGLAGVGLQMAGVDGGRLVLDHRAATVEFVAAAVHPRAIVGANIVADIAAASIVDEADLVSIQLCSCEAV